jgi:hypothetical protein
MATEADFGHLADALRRLIMALQLFVPKEDLSGVRVLLPSHDSLTHFKMSTPAHLLVSVDGPRVWEPRVMGVGFTCPAEVERQMCAERAIYLGKNRRSK